MWVSPLRGVEDELPDESPFFDELPHQDDPEPEEPLDDELLDGLEYDSLCERRAAELAPLFTLDELRELPELLLLDRPDDPLDP
jgi:hypothetical protein